MNAKIIVLAALLSGSAICSAQTGGSQPTNPNGQTGAPPMHHHRGPPPQAIAACDGKKSGDACSFAGRENETVSGTCFSPPAREAMGGDSQPQGERPMACRPLRAGHGGSKAPS